MHLSISLEMTPGRYFYIPSPFICSLCDLIFWARTWQKPLWTMRTLSICYGVLPSPVVTEKIGTRLLLLLLAIASSTSSSSSSWLASSCMRPEKLHTTIKAWSWFQFFASFSSQIYMIAHLLHFIPVKWMWNDLCRYLGSVMVSVENFDSVKETSAALPTWPMATA